MLLKHFAYSNLKIATCDLILYGDYFFKHDKHFYALIGCKLQINVHNTS